MTAPVITRLFRNALADDGFQKGPPHHLHLAGVSYSVGRVDHPGVQNKLTLDSPFLIDELLPASDPLDADYIAGANDGLYASKSDKVPDYAIINDRLYQVTQVTAPQPVASVETSP